MIILVEIVNMALLLAQNSITNVVLNFMAVAVIADFDDLFYGALF